MMRTPAFRLGLRVELAPGAGVFFISESGQFIVNGPVAEDVARLIDGKRSVDEIASTVAGGEKARDVRDLVEALEHNRVIYDREGNEPLPELALWNCAGADIGDVSARLARETASVVTLGEAAAGTEMTDALEAHGVTVSAGGALTIVCCDDYLDPRLEAVNRELLAAGRAWMLVKPGGLLPLIGPIMRPRETACWACLAQRMQGRRASEILFDKPGTSESLARAIPASKLNHNGIPHLAAVQAAKWMALGRNDQLEGRIISLDPLTLVTTSHLVIRRPQCPACGDPPAVAARPEPPSFENRAKQVGAESGQRSASPEETFARCQHHLSPVTGLVSELTPLTQGADEIIKLYVATHNYALDRSSPLLLKHSLESKSGGKGISEAQARTGALVEALERYCGVFQGDEKRITASFRSLGDAAVHPNEAMLYSARQYERRDAWNALGSTFMLVPLPFDETAEIEWSPVWSFGRRDFRYLPTAYLYYGYPGEPGRATCWADSNGNAAGNSVEEAIVHGFLEIVERDAVAMWWYNRLTAPAVDIASFADPYLDRCGDHYRRIGRQLWVLDVTNDFGIPTFVSISRRAGRTPEEITLGFGCHLDARAAVLRAVTEMNQFLPAVSGPIDASGERRYAYNDRHAIHWWRTASLASQPYLAPNQTVPPRVAADYPSGAPNDQLWDVMTCVKRAEALGLDTLFLDQSRPDVEIKVAKVIVPGARHFWARLAPGRLYDVPVKLGRLARPSVEDELNPIPMFL